LHPLLELEQDQQMDNQNITNEKSRRNIFALGFASFFTDISSEMVLSLLPAFIISLPGSNVFLLGIIEGVAEALSYGMRAILDFFQINLAKENA
jgi:hypothetical protein